MSSVKIVSTLSVLGIFALLLIGCQSIQQDPEDVYMRYWEACNSGDMATAETLVTEGWKERSLDFGVCVFTHDWFTRFGQSIGSEQTQEFTSNSPKIEIAGNTAYLSWTETNNRKITVVMYKVDGQWKVHEAGF